MLGQFWTRATPGRLAAATCAACLTLAVALPASSSAQKRSRNEPIAPFSTVYGAAGTLLIDVSKLNAHFERTDLDAKDRPGFFTLSNDGYSIGLGGYGAVYNRLLLGAEWHTADMGQESSPTGKTNQLATTYWMATGGYAAWTTWRMTLMPFVGIGTGTMKLTLKSRNGGATVPDGIDPTFDEVIRSPGSISTMSGSYVMVQPGLGVDFLMLKSDASQMGVVIGLRFASTISPNRTTWKYQGREVFGGPDVGPSGGVVRIIAGIGGFRLGSAPAPRR